MIRRMLCLAALLGALTSTTGCKCWQGFFKGDLCAECDPYGGGTFYCGEGCGEKHQGDWISHPPDGCEPCDRHGNYMGRGGYNSHDYVPAELQGEFAEPPHGSVIPTSHSSHHKCPCGHH